MTTDVAVSLAQLLAEAYHRDQVMHDRAGAVSRLRGGVSRDLRAEAEAELARLAAVVRVREMPGMGHGCHVSKVLCDLLGAALQ